MKSKVSRRKIRVTINGRSYNGIIRPSLKSDVHKSWWQNRDRFTKEVATFLRKEPITAEILGKDGGIAIGHGKNEKAALLHAGWGEVMGHRQKKMILMGCDAFGQMLELKYGGEVLREFEGKIKL